MENDFLGRFVRTKVGSIDDNFGIRWLFIRIRHAGEVLEYAGPGLRVETLAIALFTNLNRGRKMHHYKSAKRLNHRSYLFSGGVIGCDRSADGDSTIFGYFGSHVANAANVEIAVFLGKSELG